MTPNELAGKPAPYSMVENIPRLVSAYFTGKPDVNHPSERVLFGTSGHRGTSTAMTFNEPHVLAICQAICEYRRLKGISGPLYLGMDTHALSEAAFITAIEVFAANQVDTVIQQDFGYTPTPVISHAILTYNRGKASGQADGVVITPSHNPPSDGGFKYNPPSAGPADTETTRIIQDRANEILANELREVKRIGFNKALKTEWIHLYNFVHPYTEDLSQVLDIHLIRDCGLKLGVDPLGGATFAYWEEIENVYQLDLQVVNQRIDPTFSFMTVDHDGKIRMDCSSPYAMAGLIQMKDRFRIAFGSDPDGDRHGIVAPSVGLMNPNHFLAVAVWYLFQNRPDWRKDAAVGKTLVSSSMIDRVASNLGLKLYEVPVGFKWFVNGLLTGEYGFTGEESAGASFLRKDGTVWTTDKDGIIMGLLAAEITAKTGRDPGEHYHNLESLFGQSYYERIDVPASPAERTVLSHLSPDMVKAKELAGEEILYRITRAPGNDAPFGGLKIVTRNGWFAARPSGTENIYKIYAESFKGVDHLAQVLDEARSIVRAALVNANS